MITCWMMPETRDCAVKTACCADSETLMVIDGISTGCSGDSKDCSVFTGTPQTGVFGCSLNSCSLSGCPTKGFGFARVLFLQGHVVLGMRQFLHMFTRVRAGFCFWMTLLPVTNVPGSTGWQFVSTKPE